MSIAGHQMSEGMGNAGHDWLGWWDMAE